MNLQTSEAPLKSQAQSTGLFTSAFMRRKTNNFALVYIRDRQMSKYDCPGHKSKASTEQQPFVML